MKKLYLFIIFPFYCNAQIINAYAKVTVINGAATTLTVNNVNEASHTFTVGGKVVIMQMQDNVIGTNTTNVNTFGDLGSIANTGIYEIRTIAARSPAAGTPTTITLSFPLVGVYNTGSNSSCQLITFRDMGINFTTTTAITGLAWNGSVGGLVAFEVANTLTLNHSINADFIGFRKGLVNSNPVAGSCLPSLFITSSINQAFKGEGIYKATDITFINARGKIINGGGGGNEHNAGGGGGGNFTSGGAGGFGYSCNAGANNSGGLGGLSLSSVITANRVFMGGGGGGGQQNNTVGLDGGNGGGIVLIKANTIATNTICGSAIKISANGESTTNAGNDGAGGGGAAGSIILQVSNYSINPTCPLTINANGGNGGNVSNSAEHGGGGGGGQGVIIFSIPQPTLNITTATTNGTGGQNNSSGASFAGNGGGTNNSGLIINTNSPLPLQLLNFTAQNEDTKVDLTWATATEKNTNFFYIERSADAMNWETIGKVKAAENSNHTLYYQTYDNDPLLDISYYRLKIVDIDQSFSYSLIQSIYRADNKSFVILFPNPTNGLLNITSSYNVNKLQCKLLDITGKELGLTIVNKTENKLVYDISNLAKGIYFIHITTPNGEEFNNNRVILK